MDFPAVLPALTPLRLVAFVMGAALWEKRLLFSA
jgi:hypothetical protein